MPKQRSISVDLYGFTVDHAHYSCDVVQSLTICLLWVQSSNSGDVLVSALEHKFWVQCHLPDLVLRILQRSCVVLEQTKESFIGDMVKVFLGLPKDYSSLLLITQNKIVEYAWVPSFSRQKGAPATAAKTLTWHHYCHINTNSSMLFSLHEIQRGPFYTMKY